MAAIESNTAQGSTVLRIGASKEKPNPCTCAARRNQVWSTNQIARLRITPTTAAVIPAKPPLSGLLLRKVSTKGAPRPIKRKHGTKVHQLAKRSPNLTASHSGHMHGLRY